MERLKSRVRSFIAATTAVLISMGLLSGAGLFPLLEAKATSGYIVYGSHTEAKVTLTSGEVCIASISPLAGGHIPEMDYFDPGEGATIVKFTYENETDASVIVHGFHIDDIDPHDYKIITKIVSERLTPGSSTSYIVQLFPEGEDGSSVVNMSVEYNNNAAALDISCIASPESTYAKLAITTPSFSAVEQGYTQPEAKPLTIVNSGNADATISSVELSGAFADRFLLNKTDGVTIAAGSTDDTTYTVRPKAGIVPGNYNTAVIVYYNNGGWASDDLSFKVKPATTYTLAVTAPTFEAETTGYDQPEAKPLTLVNSGNTDVTITSVALDDVNADCFTLSGPENATIPAGSTDDTTWTVRPNAGLAPGDYYATVNVRYNNGQTATAGLNFTVRQCQITLEEVPYGKVILVGGGSPGERVSYYAMVYDGYYDDYVFVDLEVTDAEGNPVENDGQSFIMPESSVTVRPVFAHPEPITFEMDDQIEVMMVQTESHSWDVENAKSLMGEFVWFPPLCNEDGYVVDSVTATTESGEVVDCDWFNDYPEDMDGAVPNWFFRMPNEPVTVRVTAKQLAPAFEGNRLRLSGELGLEYCLSVPERITGGTMTFSMPNRADQVIPLADAGTDAETGWRVFDCGVYAHQMADTITATFTYTDGDEEKTVTDTCSVKQYLDSINGDIYTDSANVLADATRQYGHFIQPYLARVNGWTVGEEYAEMDCDGSPDIDAAKAGTAAHQYTLTTMDGNYVASAAYYPTFGDSTKLNLEITLNEAYDNVTLSVDGNTSAVTGDTCRAIIPDIAANNLDATHRVIVKVGDTAVFDITASVLSYVHSVLTANSSQADELNAMAALYEYWLAAENYR